MLKRRNKHFALLLVLTMLATMFVGVGTAGAATNNVALTIPVVPSTADGVTLGSFKLVEDDDTIGSIVTGQQVTVTLPSGVSYAQAPTAATLADYVTGGGDITGVTFVAGTTKSLTVSVTDAGALATPGSLTFLFNGRAAGPDGILNTADDILTSVVNLSGASGDIAIEVYAPNTGFTQGSVVVATSASAGTAVTVLSSSTVAVGTGKTVGTIRVAETRANAVKTSGGGNGAIRVVAPDGVTITAVAATPVNWAPGAAPAYNINGDGFSEYVYTAVPTAAGTTPGFINLAITVDITDRNLTGPLNFTVKGDGVTTQTVQVGAIGSYAIIAAADEAKTVKAGSVNQSIANFTLAESLANSFVVGRDFTITLPSYAHWYTNPTIAADKGTVNIVADQINPATIDDLRQEVSFTVFAGGTKSTWSFKDMKVFLDADAPEGDLIVKVEGKGLGETFNLTLGKVVKPLKAEATKSEVKIGLFDQAVSDITLTESAAGNLKANSVLVTGSYNKTTRGLTGTTALNLVLDLPAGVIFAATPTVEVTTGDLKLDTSNSKLDSTKTQLIIPIDKASTVASTIKISGIKYTLYRTVPEGDVVVNITGDALDQTGGTIYDNYDEPVETVVNALTVTPAPGEVQNTSVFAIGSTSYTINDKEQTADVAPYIKDSRTYLPIRYVAYALGIDENNIIWDGVAQTVTLIKGDKVVQLKIGSNVLLINGASITMDVAPEITSSRTFLPATWVAQAFGSTATWDALTQTVTIK